MRTWLHGEEAQRSLSSPLCCLCGEKHLSLGGLWVLVAPMCQQFWPTDRTCCRSLSTALLQVGSQVETAHPLQFLDLTALFTPGL